MDMYELCSSVAFHIHKHFILYMHNKEGLSNYKIFRKQCILQDYVHSKLYNIDTENYS